MTNMAPDISATTTGKLSQSLNLLAKPSQDTDGPTIGDTGWTSPNWTKYNGYYRTNRGGTKAPIDKFAMWAVGKGFKSDKETKELLEGIRGFGKDSYNSIIENLVRVKKINGDSYAQVIREKTITDKIKNVASKITLGFIRYAPGSGKLLNLKPLNPARVGTVVGEDGMLKEYNIMDAKREKILNTLRPNEILHFINDREADEIHGISCYESMEGLLDKIQQLDEDMTIVFHRFVVPLMMFKLNTDNVTKINEFKTKAIKAIDGGEPLFMPDKVVDADTLKIPQFATLDPLKWRESWKQDAIKDIGIPELVLGTATGVTEASAKIVYLSFQQTVEDEQRYIEEQLKLQLGVEVKYEFPARIEENLGEDEGKDGKINTGKRSEVKITSEKVGDGTGNPV